MRTFTGWDEEKGRLSTASNLPIFGKMNSKPKAFAAGADNSFVLNTAPVGIKIVIDFTASGNFAVEPDVALALRWHQKNVQQPLNLGMPQKIVLIKPPNSRVATLLYRTRNSQRCSSRMRLF